ncbi:murein L,D-transpeptidase [Methylocella sp.]|uniref:murein L,D-transpeptidase n=1 Tax=Methylocella sp. TaxID=1978226 RepID=UPI00378354C2
MARDTARRTPNVVAAPALRVALALAAAPAFFLPGPALAQVPLAFDQIIQGIGQALGGAPAQPQGVRPSPPAPAVERAPERPLERASGRAPKTEAAAPPPRPRPEERAAVKPPPAPPRVVARPARPPAPAPEDVTGAIAPGAGDAAQISATPGAARAPLTVGATRPTAAAPSPAPAPAAPDAAAAPPPAETSFAAPAAPVADPAPASAGAAIRALLEARGEQDRADRVPATRRREHDAVAAFYAQRGFAPLWTRNGEARAEVKPVLARLQLAAEDALVVRAPVFQTSDDPAKLAAADVALSDAVVAYARQASAGRVDPRSISPLIALRPEAADPSLALALVSEAGAQAGAALRGFNPPQPGYAALRDKLAETRRAGAPTARRQAPAIPPGPTLKLGMSDPRVPLIRARLSLDGRPAGGDAQVYDTQVASAVADFQKANGLPSSGQLTPKTLVLLSGPEQSRVEGEIVANMERWRWTPRDLGASRIEVNLPEFEVVVVENGAVVARHRVVVGKDKTPTPVFSNTMRYLIVNPAWNVPQSIIRKEMMPKLAADPNYLRRLGYQAEWKNGRLSVRQPPGERNALGRIKFMFPNDYAVYLHDTPSRKLFSEERRMFSHGCVRVDEPMSFAETVLGRGWTQERLEKLIGGDKERYVNLARPLPIHLEYFTAKVDAYGRLLTFEDVYGYSRKIRVALGYEKG